MKKKKNVSWGNIIVSLIFIFNPNIGLVDILPDAIGYILLFRGLSRISMIDDRIGEAYSLFVRLFYITLVRLASLFITFSVLPLTDRNTALLLFSFTFDVLELIALVPAIIKLFDGILYLAERHGGEAAYCRAGKSRRTVTERARNTALVFVFAKAFCGTLPEFATLSSHRGWDETAVGRMHLYIGMFRTVGIICSLVFGVVFLVVTLRYIDRLRKETSYVERLTAVYDAEIGSRTDYLARRAISAAFGYFSVAAVLTIDFSLDNFNILPDVLSALCLIAGLLTVRKYIASWKKTAIIASVYGVVASVIMVLEGIFASRYYVDAIDVDPETYTFHICICLVHTVAALLFIATVTVFTRKTMAEIIDKHTGFSMTSNDTYDPTAKIRQLHRELRKRLVVLVVLSIASAVICVISKFFVTTLGFLWIFGFVIDAVYAIYTFKVLGEIKEQIDYKYMLS